MMLIESKQRLLYFAQAGDAELLNHPSWICMWFMPRINHESFTQGGAYFETNRRLGCHHGLGFYDQLYTLPAA